MKIQPHYLNFPRSLIYPLYYWALKEDSGKFQLQFTTRQKAKINATNKECHSGYVKSKLLHIQAKLYFERCILTRAAHHYLGITIPK